MKVLIGILFALIPALLMSVPIGLFAPYAGLLIFIFIFIFGLVLSVLFGEDRQYDKL